MDKSQVKKVSVNETNEAGFGIKNITVTPYEVCIESILPEMDNDSLNQMCREYKNTCVQQLGEEAAEQFLAEGSFDSGYPGWEGGFAVFDQNGERVPYGYVLELN